MKLRFTHITIAAAFVLSTVGLLSQQTSAASQESPLTPAQANQFSRDLVPSTPSQDFFRQGQQRIEREIQLLLQRRNASSEELLRINVNSQAELDRLPQLQQDNLPQTSVGQ